MHIALLGGSGYIGSCFRNEFQRRGHQLSMVSRAACDFYAQDQLRSLIDKLQPDYLVNSAGYTGKPNVDACELDKANCMAGNAVLPGIIGKVCQDLRLPWGHVSSGCIYTGSKPDGSGFTETDPPNFSFRQNNCSFYSGTKALGEEILCDYPECHVWRLRIPFSHVASPRNYLSKVIKYDRLLDAENSLSNLQEFVDAAIDCIDKELPYGIYNLTNPGSLTTRQVVDIMRDSGFTTKAFDFFDSEDEFMSIAAKTPRSNCVLDSSKAASLGLKLSPIEESVRTALEKWIPDQAQVQCGS